MSRTIDPIVSTDWLEADLEDSERVDQAGAGDLAIIDIRFEEEYARGHIPGAISVPFAIVSVWSDCTDDLLLELPNKAELFKVMGACGLTAGSRVVVVGRVEEPPAPPYPLADAVRVAVTLMWAGVKNVAILEGGHAKWEKEGRATPTEIPAVEPVAYSARVDEGMWVSTEYVRDHIGRSVIVDGRDPDQYFGASIDPFADMRGHIATARNLPAVWLWEPDGTYREKEFIQGIATGVIGEDRKQEVLLYCGVGGYASTWWFILTELLGYENAKIYDGSAEAWVKENPLVRYTWTS